MGFITKIDGKVIDTLDSLTTKLQKKGITPLNTLNMAARVLFGAIWFTSLHFNGIVSTALNSIMLLIIALGLFGSYLEWQEQIGYWEDHRKTLRLNAVVTMNRSLIKPRIVLVIGMSPLLICGGIIPDLTLISGTSMLYLLEYLKCCHFVGPGEYSSERKTKLMGLPEST